MTEYEQKLQGFRDRLGLLAIEAQRRGLTPVDVAGSFHGIGLGTLQQHYGEDAANHYFSEMVRELRAGESWPKVVGTA